MICRSTGIFSNVVDGLYLALFPLGTIMSQNESTCRSYFENRCTSFLRLRDHWFIALTLLGVVCLACAAWAWNQDRPASQMSNKTNRVAPLPALPAENGIRYRTMPLRIQPHVPHVTLSRDWESIDALSKRM